MNTTFGRYRLLERLGQGGMAEVFKAKSYGVEGFEKVVVIKRILPALAESDPFVDMFIHEAKLAVRLSHANIVQVFDLGIAPGTVVAGKQQPDAYYMAMEYVNGLDLATLLARCRRADVRIPIEMAVYVAAEVAKGLDHAHRRRDEQNEPLNIVHLDVSPQNVLLSLEGEVKVTDFGIAKARGALHPKEEDTRSHRLEGKFGYMSPEHAAGHAVDARSDLFSLGTVLYEMLAGVNPFTAPTSFETLRRVQACEFPPVELLRPDVPPELVSLLKSAIRFEMDARFPDAGRMYEALLAFLYSQGRRFSAHDLANFLGGFRLPEEAGPLVILDAEGAPSQERTPVEIPASRREFPSMTRIEVAPSSPDLQAGLVVDVGRAAELGERREVTALAIELPASARGSLPPPGGESGASLGERAVDAITRYGGRIVSHEPETITALFGVDDPDGRDTEVATRCALVVLRSLSGARPPSAGLHVGRIHVTSEGQPTEDERLSVLVSTARDLARVREGMCAISASAMRQVRTLFVFDTLDVSRPGVSTTMTLLVKDVRGTSDAFGRFVGRREELRTVGEMLASATRRTASVLTVKGDHGIGKSRLLFEVERRLRKGGYNVGWYLATCLPRGTDRPLSGIECMLQALCGVAEGDAEPRIRQVVPRLRALGLQEDEVSAVLSALGAASSTSSGLSPIPPPVRRHDDKRRRHGGADAKPLLANAFTRVVQRLCEDRPHAFAWDSAHSMDAESYALLGTVIERIPASRALFVLATRAGFTHPLERLGVHAPLDLSDLAPEEIEKLISVRLAVTRVPPELVRFVRERAGGHPQMIEEVLKGLVEARALTVADGSVVTMKLVGQDLSLPKTLRGLVASRIARLDAQGRGILQAAAILGDPINASVLGQMIAMPMVALDKALATLKEHGFLVQTGPIELRFASPIFREVVVDALTAEASREMHAAAGLALEKALGLRGKSAVHPADQAARIATHLYSAGERNRAGLWFAKSAVRRLEAGQFDAATRDYARAIELGDLSTLDTDSVMSWFADLAKAVRFAGALPEAMEICETVIARVDASSSTDMAESDERRVRVRIDAGRILGTLHMFDAARAQLGSAEAIAQNRPALAKSALVAAADLAGRQGDFARSLALLERMQSVATEIDEQEEFKLLVSLVQANAAMGDHVAAMRHFERACGVLPTEPTAICERYKLRGLIDYFSRDFRAAALNSERAIDKARELGLQYEVAMNLHNLADVLILLEDHPRAYGALKQSVALCDELGYERLASHNRMFLAYLDALAGDTGAERVLVQGIRYAESNDYTWDVLGGRQLLARLRVFQGDTDAARLEFQKLRALAKTAGNRLIADDCLGELRAMGATLSQPPPGMS